MYADAYQVEKIRFSGISSAGKAKPLQAWGREFGPRYPLHFFLPLSRNAPTQGFSGLVLSVLFQGNRQAIDAIALACLCWAVGKHVAQMSTAFLAQHLGADHAVTGIPRLLNNAL